MESVLIVAGSENSRTALSGLARMCGLSKQALVSSGSDARRLLVDNDYDLVLINSPLPDEFGSELAITACGALSSAILLVKAEVADEISEKVETAGVFVLEKPINKALLFKSIHLAGVQQVRLSGLQKENRKLKDKIEEIRMVDRAKCLLIQFEGMTENDAHRYIEKTAMDGRVSRLSIAKNILKTYESSHD